MSLVNIYRLEPRSFTTGHRHIDAGSVYIGQLSWILGVQTDHKLLILWMAKGKDVCRQLGLEVLSTKILRSPNHNCSGDTRVNLWELVDLLWGTLKPEMCESPPEMTYFDVQCFIFSELLGYKILCCCPAVTAPQWTVNLDSILTLNEHKGVL